MPVGLQQKIRQQLTNLCIPRVDLPGPVQVLDGQLRFSEFVLALRQQQPIQLLAWFGPCSFDELVSGRRRLAFAEKLLAADAGAASQVALALG